MIKENYTYQKNIEMFEKVYKWDYFKDLDKRKKKH